MVQVNGKKRDELHVAHGTEKDEIERLALASEKAQKYMSERRAHRDRVRNLRFDTIAVHGMYSAEEAFSGGQGGIIEPIFPSTSQAYRDSDEMEGPMYSTPMGAAPGASKSTCSSET